MAVYYPFRPALHGAFLDRFYSLAEEACSQPDPRLAVQALALREYRWATGEIRVNPRQRRIYRSVWLLLRDLVRAWWSFRLRDGTLEVAPPDWPNHARGDDEIRRIKSQVRDAMAAQRRDKLVEAREFIQRVENPSSLSKAKVPMPALVADGRALAADLRRAIDSGDETSQLANLGTVVRPYLQLVRENEFCEHTGYRLGDIWRYFRFSWSTPPENTPGRTLLYLVRDAARQLHPVVALISLENAPIKISDRDAYLGWTVEAFVREVSNSSTPEEVRRHFDRLLRYLDLGMDSISLVGLCDHEECKYPPDDLLERLALIANRSMSDHQSAVRAWDARYESPDDDEAGLLERSEMGNISTAAEDALYVRKRAGLALRYLSSRRAILDLLSFSDFESRYQQFLNVEKGQMAVRWALIAMKSRHIGTSLLELNVCGAIPPYNEILGGKLAALLTLSPQVVADYRERYGNRPSDIASKLKGEDVIRPAELVYVGTSSLYKSGYSQYNRVSLPAGIMKETGPAVKWQLIGETTGYGTLHFSRLTHQCLEELATRDGRATARHVFGEGASPKLRTIRLGLEIGLEHSRDETDMAVTRHSMGRLVFGAYLASNGAAYLRGEESEPHYYFDRDISPSEGTSLIVDHWRKRWLLPRTKRDDVLSRIESFDPEILRAGRDLQETEEPTFVSIVEENLAMPLELFSDESRQRDFLRKLYRGSSAYSDHIEQDLLELIHIPTKLDDALIDCLSKGKSVVLTGNPGDGKTHLMRILASKIAELPNDPLVELDASRVRDPDLYAMWEMAERTSRPFCVAINEAVLFNLASMYPEFKPLQEARRQAEHSVVYGSREDEPAERVVVFDLSTRNVLEQSVVSAVLDKFTDPVLFPSCADCPAEGCDFVRHRQLLRVEQVRNRLQLLLNRVTLRGYHTTLRELVGFVSYLLFAERSCNRLLKESGDPMYGLPQLVLNGKSGLFSALQQSFDPAHVTHPHWDDALVNATTSPGDWIAEWSRERDSLDANSTNLRRFEARKRAFYFFHSSGEAPLKLNGDDTRRFADLLGQVEREAIRSLVRGINSFFGDKEEKDRLRVWQSHRYDQSTRKILYSYSYRERREFELVRPRVRSTMADGLDLSLDHVLLRLKQDHSCRLRVDFELYQLLSRAERGVPMMAMENEVTRRVWKFMEQLSHAVDEGEWSDFHATLLDPVCGEQLEVTVDADAGKYLDIKVR